MPRRLLVGGAERSIGFPVGLRWLAGWLASAGLAAVAAVMRVLSHACIVSVLPPDGFPVLCGAAWMCFTLGQCVAARFFCVCVLFLFLFRFMFLRDADDLSIYGCGHEMLGWLTAESGVTQS